jgi:hypothetical protein
MKIYEWIYYMSFAYPNITEVINIGSSIENKSLLVFKVNDLLFFY